MLGANNLKKIFGATKMIRIKRTIQHPKYIATNKYDDIALFELVRKLKFNEFIRPACLNTNTKTKWSTALASGYGQLSFGNFWSHDFASNCFEFISMHVVASFVRIFILF